MDDILDMDIQAASMYISHTRVQEEAAIRVLAMGMDSVREQASAVENLINHLQTITDPALGRYVNIEA